MPKFDPSKPRSLIAFHCVSCEPGRTFDAAPARIEDAPELEYHPFRYFGWCTRCQAEVGQAQYEQALFKAWCSATGPRTEEGKAAATKNLEGHPTPEEAMRTRFNAMKHGLSARTATYFPAKPDGYDFCKQCKVDRDYCAAQSACVTKTELFMLHQAAFEQRDPKRLMGLYSDLHSAVFAVIQQMVQTILADGVKIVSPQWYTDKETGGMLICQYMDPVDHQVKVLYELEAHPLFKPLGEFLSRVGITLADLGMTVKVIESEEIDTGRIEKEEEAREVAGDFQRRQVEALEHMTAHLQRARKEADQDPVLIEYKQEHGES